MKKRGMPSAGIAYRFCMTPFEEADRMRLLLLLSATLLLTPMSAFGQSTYDVVVSGMRCAQQSSGQLDCEFHVGRSLRFVIAGVGQNDAAITFFKVDFDGDFYASVGLLHGCVIVKPARPDPAQGLPTFAFVSPKNGRVYRDWQSCQKP
jgi:hypothetical protein